MYSVANVKFIYNFYVKVLTILKTKIGAEIKVWESQWKIRVGNGNMGKDNRFGQVENFLW